VNTSEFISLALAFPNTTQVPHFDRIAFRTPRRIFASLDMETGEANIRLTPVIQSVYTQASPEIFAVPNKWGSQGWTTVRFQKLSATLVREMLESAHAWAIQ